MASDDTDQDTSNRVQQTFYFVDSETKRELNKRKDLLMAFIDILSGTGDKKVFYTAVCEPFIDGEMDEAFLEAFLKHANIEEDSDEWETAFNQLEEFQQMEE